MKYSAHQYDALINEQKNEIHNLEFALRQEHEVGFKRMVGWASIALMVATAATGGFTGGRTGSALAILTLVAVAYYFYLANDAAKLPKRLQEAKDRLQQLIEEKDETNS